MVLTQIRNVSTLMLCALFAAALVVSPDALAKKKKKKKRHKKEKDQPAEVETTKTPPEGDGYQSIARDSYNKGKALYEEGKYAEALVEFQAAYDAKPHPVVLKSIAECQAQSGDIPAAIATLEKYLLDPEATDKPEIEARIEELKRTPINVEITSDPAGAKIEVAGVDTGKVTPATLELNPGEYAVRLTAEGMAPVQENINVVLGEENKLAAVMTPAEAAEPAAATPMVDDFSTEPPPAPEASQDSGPPTAFWAMAAVAGIGLVSGTVFGTMALGDEDDYKEEPTQDKKEAGRRDAILADVSFGLAGAAAIAGTIIYVVHRKKTKRESAARLRMTPVVGQKTVGFSAAIDF